MMKGLLVSGEELVEKYADYALAGMSQLLRYELRDRNFVVVTDIGSIAGIRQIERELCDQISIARQQKAWIIGSLCADDLISTSWLPELRKELENGLIVHMDAPDAATRRAILARHASGGTCNEDIVDRLSGIANLGSALSELRGAYLDSSESKQAAGQSENQK
jgi:chromosomal replication initiation ATPase DnaA